MSKLILALLALSGIILVATQLIEYPVLNLKTIIPPGETELIPITLHKGSWIRAQAYFDLPIYSAKRLLMIYMLDEEEYQGFTGENNTLREMIRAAHVASWEVSTDFAEASLIATYIDRIDYDSRYYIVLDNGSPAIYASEPKTVDFRVTVKDPSLSYLAVIPIIIAVTFYIQNWRKGVDSRV